MKKKFLHKKHNTRRLSIASIPPLRTAILFALLSNAHYGYAQNSASPGNGDPQSWMTPEFNTNTGLATINAQYAYARGLSGTGVTIGIFDNGMGMGHPEFSGKSINSISAGDQLANGQTCSNTTLLNDSACFFSSGNQITVNYLDYDSGTWQSLVDKGFISEDLRQQIYDQDAYGHYDFHGTHVSGIIVANRDGTGMHGTAFGSNLYAARVFSNTYTNTPQFVENIGGNPDQMGVKGTPVELSLFPTNTAFASMYSQMQAQGVRVINHSWSLDDDFKSASDLDTFYSNQDTQNFLSTFAQPSANGQILQVWAAGNTPGDIAGIIASLPRYNPQIEPYWLSVVNVTQSGTLSSNSSSCGASKNWCVAAPGEDITSTIITNQPSATPIYDANGNAQGLAVQHTDPQYGYGDMTGTSMAAPYVTGALALLIERYPYLNNAQVREVLLTTTTDLGDPGVDDTYGWGLINLQKAINGPSILRSDMQIAMDVRDGGTPPANSIIWDEWTNDLSGPGQLTKIGAGWLKLSGNNTFAGTNIQGGTLELAGQNALSKAVNVNNNAVFVLSGSMTGSDLNISQGLAVINGSLSAGTTTVGSQSVLKGNGSLGPTIVNGVIAPGNSIGKLVINGNYTQSPTGTYLTEINNGSSDVIQVNGAARIDGTLKVTSTPGVPILGQQYAFLLANNGVTGQFANIDTSGLSPFLSTQLQYASNQVVFRILRGDSLSLHGKTPNQNAVAKTLDSFLDNNVLIQNITSLMPSTAQQAMDYLSGEIYATLPTTFAVESRVIRDTAITHARFPIEQTSRHTSSEDTPITAWAEVEHTQQTLDGTYGVAKASSHQTIPFIGVDTLWNESFKVGGLIGGGKTNTDVKARRSHASSKSHYLGAYASKIWNNFIFSGGIAEAIEKVDTTRDIDLGSTFNEHITSSHDATTRQIFLESHWNWHLRNMLLEPFAEIAQIHVVADALTERGGSAALHVQKRTETVRTVTTGVRWDSTALFTNSNRWNINGSLAYRYSGNDLSTDAHMTLMEGGMFTVHGGKQSKSAAIARLGFAYATTPNSNIHFGYTGVFSSNVHESQAYLGFSMLFQ